jgi:hypothetical protein
MIPYPRPNPNLQDPIQVLPMPILGGFWPTVAFEFSDENESIPQMKRDRDNYISGHTGINVWIGVVYHRINSDDRDTWWMSVAVRDIGNQQNAQANVPNLIVVGELPIQPNGHIPRLGRQRNEQWHIPTALLFYPQNVPALNPALPPHYVVLVEDWRRYLLETRNL